MPSHCKQQVRQFFHCFDVLQYQANIMSDFDNIVIVALRFYDNHIIAISIENLKIMLSNSSLTSFWQVNYTQNMSLKKWIRRYYCIKTTEHL